MTQLHTWIGWGLLAVGLSINAQAANQDPSCLVAYSQRFDMRYVKIPAQTTDATGKASDAKTRDGKPLWGKFKCIKPEEPIYQRDTQIRRAFYDDSQPENWPKLADQLIHTQLNTLRKRPTTQDASLEGAFNDLVNALQVAAGELDNLHTLDDLMGPNAASYSHLTIPQWAVDGIPFNEPHGLAARYLQSNGCLPAVLGGPEVPVSPKCETAYLTSTQIADEVYLVKVVVSTLRSNERTEFLEQATLRTERWKQYLDVGLKAQPQFSYWWELALNHYAESQCKGIWRWDCARAPTDPYGNELGFRDAPDHKLILLHPDIGVEYLNHEPKGSQIKPALLFQWFGYQKWTWAGSTAVGLKGISLVSTVADTKDSNRVGIGLAFQLEGYTLAITGHGRNVGVTINTALIDHLGSVNPQLAQELKAPLQ